MLLVVGFKLGWSDGWVEILGTNDGIPVGSALMLGKRLGVTVGALDTLGIKEGASDG